MTAPIFIGHILRLTVGQSAAADLAVDLVKLVIEHYSTGGKVVEEAILESTEEAWETIIAALPDRDISRTLKSFLISADKKRLIRETHLAIKQIPNMKKAKPRDQVCQRMQQVKESLFEHIHTGIYLDNTSFTGNYESSSYGLNNSWIPHDILPVLTIRSDPSKPPLWAALTREYFLLKVGKNEKLHRCWEFLQLEKIRSEQLQLTSLLHTFIERSKESTTLAPQLRIEQSFSIHSPEEKRYVREALGWFRSLSKKEQDKQSEWKRVIGQRLFEAGALGEAHELYSEIAQSEGSNSAQALAYYNAFLAALGRRKWSQALADLLRSAQLEPSQFAPFPLDHYQPVAILGAGGFSVVFQCVDLKQSRQVVIKVLNRSNQQGSLSLETNLTKMRQLCHPSILVPFEIGYMGEDRSRPYLVMDYFPGSTLRQHLESHHDQGMAWQDWLPIGIHIAEALQVAHEKDILHRDLKPENILIRFQGNQRIVKIIDFGLGMQMRTPESEYSAASLVGQSLVGTRQYAPPEQTGEFPEAPQGFWSDIYSFGRVACRCLWGTTEPRRRHWKSLPEPLATLLEETIEQDFRLRPDKFEDILLVLKSFPHDKELRHQQDSAHPSPITDKFKKIRKRGSGSTKKKTMKTKEKSRKISVVSHCLPASLKKSLRKEFLNAGGTPNDWGRILARSISKVEGGQSRNWSQTRWEDYIRSIFPKNKTTTFLNSGGSDVSTGKIGTPHSKRSSTDNLENIGTSTSPNSQIRDSPAQQKKAIKKKATKKKKVTKKKKAT